MKSLLITTLIVSLMLFVGEIARWWNDPRLFPMAVDEVLVSAIMAWAVFRVRQDGPSPLLAAWGLYSGLMLSLLVPTVDHMLFGPPKESAAFYAAVLTVMLLLGVWGIARSLKLCRLRQR